MVGAAGRGGGLFRTRASAGCNTHPGGFGPSEGTTGGEGYGHVEMFQYSLNIMPSVSEGLRERNIEDKERFGSSLLNNHTFSKTQVSVNKIRMCMYLQRAGALYSKATVNRRAIIPGRHKCYSTRST